MSLYSRIFALACALSFSIVSLNAADWSYKTQATLSAEPNAINYYGKSGDTLIFDVFCNGYDSKFNGILDSGDSRPSWYRLYLSSTDFLKSEKILDMDMGSHKWPFRYAVVEDLTGIVAQKLLFYVDNGAVKTLDLTFKTALTNSVFSNRDAFAVSALQDTMVVSVRDPNYVHDSVYVINWRTGDIYYKSPAYSMIQQTQLTTLSDNRTVLVALNEGSGASDGKITLYDYHSTPNTIDTFNIGNFGNSFSISGDYCYAVSNGDNKVYKINLLSKTIVGEYSTGTSGWNGPREIAQSSIGDTNYLFVSTYESTVAIINSSDGTISATLDAKDRAEGLCQAGNWLLVANALVKDTYSPANTVSIFYLNNKTNVEESEIASASLYPNPSVDFVNFSFNSASSRNIDIYNAQGVKFASYISNGESLKVRADFPAGAYFAVINNGGKISRLTFVKISL